MVLAKVRRGDAESAVVNPTVYRDAAHSSARMAKAKRSGYGCGTAVSFVLLILLLLVGISAR
jgi:hypothetical protein